MPMLSASDPQARIAGLARRRMNRLGSRATLISGFSQNQLAAATLAVSAGVTTVIAKVSREMGRPAVTHEVGVARTAGGRGSPIWRQYDARSYTEPTQSPSLRFVALPLTAIDRSRLTKPPATVFPCPSTPV